MLNNHEIFNEIEKLNVEPIKVSKDFLATNNNMKIEVSGAGKAFWSTNEYLREISR